MSMNNNIKEELGKWLMDVSKYIATAVILTSVFGEIQQKWIIYIGGEHAYKMADDVSSHEQIPWTPPKKPSAFKRFRMRLWEDVVSSFWKSFAYGLLICCTCFAGYEYYYNRKLVRIAKEYTIVRHYLEQYPDYKQRLNNIDTFLQEEDVYKVYRYMEQQKEKQ
jgi:hypothetical protein